MDNIFPLDKNFCRIFKKKDNPELAITKLPKYITSNISKWTLEFAKETYFKIRLCLLHGINKHIYYFNYPNIEVVDDYSLLFLFKIYKLYELKGMKIADYNSLKNSVVIFEKSVDIGKLSKYLFVLSVRDGRNYKINFTKEENMLLLAIFGSTEMDFEDEKAIDNIFNRYLRESIMTDDFYRNYVVGKKRGDIEKAVRVYFNKLKKEDSNYVENAKKVFRIQYNGLLDKLNKFYKTDEYKKFVKSIKIKPFKYPMKEYFGNDKPLQYKLFKRLIDEFELSLKK